MSRSNVSGVAYYIKPFKDEAWVRKVEKSYPRQWSTSGDDYGDFHDGPLNLCGMENPNHEGENYFTSNSIYGSSSKDAVLRPIPWEYKDIRNVSQYTYYGKPSGSSGINSRRRPHAGIRLEPLSGGKPDPRRSKRGPPVRRKDIEESQNVAHSNSLDWVFQNKLKPHKMLQRNVNQQFFCFGYKEPWKAFDK